VVIEHKDEALVESLEEAFVFVSEYFPPLDVDQNERHQEVVNGNLEVWMIFKVNQRDAHDEDS